jgi:phosphonatase-like hydrolase
MNNIELVVFDMAGTTIQDLKEVETCFDRACKQTGLEVSAERILALQGYSKIEVFNLLWKEKLGDNLQNLESNVNESYKVFKKILEEHYQNNPIYPTQHCLDTFQYLRSKSIKIALTTGFYRKVTNIILEKIGWLNGLNTSYFNQSGNAIIDYSIASDEVINGRPEPFMILKAMEILGIDNPENVINIGDTPSDLISGKKANVAYSLGVTNGTHSKEQLESVPNDGLIDDLSQLKNYIQ